MRELRVGSRELRGVFASDSGTNSFDVLEKLDILENDSGKDEYDVRTELGMVSDIEAKELRTDEGCESVAEVYEFLGESEKTSVEVSSFDRDSILKSQNFFLKCLVKIRILCQSCRKLDGFIVNTRMLKWCRGSKTTCSPTTPKLGC
jgi:hypothetical protein